MRLTMMLAVICTACDGTMTGGAGGDSGGMSAGGNGTGGTGGSAGGGTSVAVPDAGRVTGTRIDRNLLPDGGTVARPHDLTSTVISAHVLVGGSWALSTGTGTAAGTFEIPGVPDGPYVLRFADSYIYTQQRNVDVGVDGLGRADALVSGGGAMLSLTLSNLEAWGANDDLQLSSWGAGLDFYSAASRSFVQNAPSAGNTSLSGAQLAFGANRHNLVQGTRGDELRVFQLATRMSSLGFAYAAASRALTTTVDMAPGATTPVMGALVALNTSAVAFDVRFSQFSALRSAVHPSAVAAPHLLFVDVQAGPLSRHLAAATPDLLAARPPATLGDVSTMLSFGNPFPPSWSAFVVAGASFDVPYSVALSGGGASMPRSENGTVEVRVPLTGSSTGAVVPLLSPVRNVSVEASTLTPVVTWAAPATGTARTVSIQIGLLSKSETSDATRRVFVATLLVPGDVTSVRVPPGALEPGKTYFLRFTAASDGSAYDPARPFYSGAYPQAFATSFSNSFRTP